MTEIILANWGSLFCPAPYTIQLSFPNFITQKSGLCSFERLLKIHYLCTIRRKYRVIVVRCGFEFGAFLAIHPCKLPNACQQRQDGPQLLLTYRAGLKSGPQVASIFPASWGRSDKQQQGQNSTNPGTTFYPTPVEGGIRIRRQGRRLAASLPTQRQRRRKHHGELVSWHLGTDRQNQSGVSKLFSRHFLSQNLSHNLSQVAFDILRHV